MAEYMVNVASFKLCKLQLHHTPLQLARSGYKYNPTTALIQCNECYFDITSSDLSIDEISVEHLKYAPKCKKGNENKTKSNANDIVYDKALTTVLKSVAKDDKLGSLNKSLASSRDSGFGSIDSVSSLSSGRRSSDSLKSDSSNRGRLWADDFCPEGSSSALLNVVKNIAEINKKQREEQERKTLTTIDEVDEANQASAQTDNAKKEEIDETFLIKFSRHPIMSCTEERLESFKGQEQKYKHCERANIEDFVAAGLFYVGPEDNVRCFFCDGGLRNVQSHNHPFLEHKRWFPNCKFLIYLEKYNVTANTSYTTILQKDSGAPRAPARDRKDPSHVERLVTKFRLKIPGRALEARGVKARLETPIVQELMRQGFQREYLKRAIERRFILCGDDFRSTKELIQDILDVEGVKALPRPGQTNNSSQATQNPEALDGAAAAAVMRTAVSCTGQKLLGKGKDLLAAEAEFPVSEEVRNMKTVDVQNTLKSTTTKDPDLRKLWTEYQELSQVRTCKICLDREINTVFLPCGHYVTCDKCCPKISHCCICRALIRGTVLALSATCEIK